MKNKYTYIIVNSTILFVVASVVEMILHEMGHFIASILLHSKDVTLYHNYVAGSSSDLPVEHSIIIKATGPLVSLFIGVLFHWICSKQQKRNLLFLFNLYMAVFGYIGILGYVMIAPIFTYGDTGYICSVLNFPLWLTVSIAVAGAAILYFLMRSLIRYFVELGTEEIISTKELRPSFVNAVILYPLMLGIAITTFLNLPVPTFASLIAPLCSPFTIMWAYGDALSRKYPVGRMNIDLESINRFEYKLFIFLALTILVNRLLVSGFSI